MTPLHPAFADLIARKRSTPNPTEAAAFERMARNVASTSGHTLESALAQLDGIETVDTAPPAVDTRARIEALCQSSPALSDRAIAREVQCSPTHVGKIRRSRPTLNTP